MKEIFEKPSVTVQATKILKCIESCKTIEHKLNCETMIHNFYYVNKLKAGFNNLNDKERIKGLNLYQILEKRLDEKELNN